jgi:hypothetical protein
VQTSDPSAITDTFFTEKKVGAFDSQLEFLFWRKYAHFIVAEFSKVSEIVVLVGSGSARVVF